MPTLTAPKLGRKQQGDQATWQRAWETVGDWSTAGESAYLLDHWSRWIAAMIQHHGWKRVAYGWSGGKDSQALRAVMERVGITECVMGMSNLEYPEFLRWVTDHMPEGLTVVNTRQDLPWLQTHKDLLFPQQAAQAARWFEIVQHRAQAEFVKRHNIDCLILGRRRADGNAIPEGQEIRKNGAGVLHWSPLADWDHLSVLKVLYWTRTEIPPIYQWPNGWRCGTHAWPARQWTGSEENGWREVKSIDPAIVERAARYFPLARRVHDST